MALDSTLAKQLASAVAAGSGNKEKQTETRGIAKTIDGKLHAVLNGSTLATPVESTVTANDGDELLLAIKDHRAMVIGNITSNALDKATFYKLMEDGSLNLAVNNLDIAADGSVTLSAGALLNVMAGAGVNINDALILTKDGKLTLNVDSLSIGGGATVTDTSELVGPEGPEGPSGPSGHSPYVSGGYWYTWSDSDGAYKNTGILAQGPQGPKGDTGTISNYYYDSTVGSLLFNGTEDALGYFTQNKSDGFYVKHSNYGKSYANTTLATTYAMLGQGSAEFYEGGVSGNKVVIGAGSAEYGNPGVILYKGGVERAELRPSNVGTQLAVKGQFIVSTSNDVYTAPTVATLWSAYVSDSSQSQAGTTSGTRNIYLYAKNGGNAGVWSYYGASSKGLIWMSNAGAVTCNSGSSRLIKENIKAMDERRAERLLDVEVVTFDYKNGGVGDRGWAGAIAEDALYTMPEAVALPEGMTREEAKRKVEAGEDTSDFGIDYMAFVPHLIKLCQMQQQQINDLKASVEALAAK